MNAFSDAINVIFADANFTTAAEYAPPGGGPAVPCRIALNRSDRDLNVAGDTRFFVAGATIDVRASELTPVKRGTFALGDIVAGIFVPTGEVLSIQDDPRRLDADRMIWTCTVS